MLDSNLTSKARPKFKTIVRSLQLWKKSPTKKLVPQVPVARPREPITAESLPNEIWYQILGEATLIPGELLADEDDLFKTKSQDDVFTEVCKNMEFRLGLLGLSKRFRIIATPILYSSIHIQSIEQMNQVYDILLSSRELSTEGYHLGAFVQRLHLNIRGAPGYDPPRNFGHILYPLLPNLRIFIDTSLESFHEHWPIGVADVVPRLRALEVKSAFTSQYPSADSNLKFVLEHPKLESFDIQDEYSETLPDTSDEHRPPLGSMKAICATKAMSPFSQPQKEGLAPLLPLLNTLIFNHQDSATHWGPFIQTYSNHITTLNFSNTFDKFSRVDQPLQCLRQLPQLSTLVVFSTFFESVNFHLVKSVTVENILFRDKNIDLRKLTGVLDHCRIACAGGKLRRIMFQQTSAATQVEEWIKRHEESPRVSSLPYMRNEGLRLEGSEGKTLFA